MADEAINLGTSFDDSVYYKEQYKNGKKASFSKKSMTKSIKISLKAIFTIVLFLEDFFHRKPSPTAMIANKDKKTGRG